MTKDDLDAALRRWGWIYGERPDRELPEWARAPASHPIARAMEFAHRGVDRRFGPAYQRRPLPGEKHWSRDPIQCKESRQAHGSAPSAAPRNDVVTVIQTVWLELKRTDSELAEILRLEYQDRDQQTDKAKALGIGRGKYRELLAEAKGWMFARVHPRAVA